MQMAAASVKSQPDRQYNVTQLFSPPPEETLRRTAVGGGSVFHLDDLPPSSDAWSDSDEDVSDDETIEEGEGQYTGRWRTLLVKTKQDPPSSIDRARMEHWGRPVSPFPEEAKSFQLLDEEEEQAQDSLGSDIMEGMMDENLDQDEQDEIDEEEVRRISVEPEDEHDVPMQITRVHNVEPGVVPMNNFLLDDASDDDSDNERELSFVKITSADPRAAARAAAILKQHDYDCFTEITNSKRRRSAPDKMLGRGTTIAEALARKGIAEGRITKSKAKKRSSLVGTGVIGSQVFISGAPIMTLRNLLEEVESEVSFIGTPTKGGRETPPSHRLSLGMFDCSFVNHLTSREGESEWTKDDWKLLDACFTNERLIVGRRLQLEGDQLADVDAINIDCVVDRYVGILGGENSIKRLGVGWKRDVIVQRAKALRKKQRSGNIAPPTTPMSITVDRTPDVDIPDFTPLQRPPTFGARVKGFLSSYFPTLSRTAPVPSRKTLNTVQPRLPLPPPDLLDKPRAPITTPARPSLPKPKHPKELVRLNPAPLPKSSLIPRLKPRRLVQLNPVPPPKAREPIPILKPRNSSGSVKDLVQSFEELKKMNECP